MPLLFLLLYSKMFLSISTITAIMTRMEDTANAEVMEVSVPDIYKASISSGRVNVCPLVFESALTAPNSPNARAVHKMIPVSYTHLTLPTILLV